MGRSLWFLGALATVGIAVTAALGFGLSSAADPGMPRHVIAALASTLPLMLAHSWILLYLLGTGKVVRDAVREGGLDPAPLARSRHLRRICYPVILLAAVLVMATFLVGGAVAANSVPAWVHQTLFWTAIAVQALALWIEWWGLAGNESLLVEVDRRLIAAAPVSAAGA
ncbi:MAG TPA: hypothetical protein VFR03_10015 [Thermoanaerobaculia bacterium]|nr:hypothetical protein [Thermoanaerobaculia bacterium]